MYIIKNGFTFLLTMLILILLKTVSFIVTYSIWMCSYAHITFVYLNTALKYLSLAMCWN